MTLQIVVFSFTLEEKIHIILLKHYYLRGLDGHDHVYAIILISLRRWMLDKDIEKRLNFKAKLLGFFLY